MAGKTSVCITCNNDIEATDELGRRVCPICGCYDFKEVEYKTPTCVYCSVEWSQEHGFKKPPFYNAQTNTFYCGCRGWD